MERLIGITGKSGVCKSTVGKMLAKRYKNCTYVDVDKIGHSVLRQPEVIKILTEKFDDIILDDSGNIDRKKLRDLVFTEKCNLQFLEETTWPFIEKELDKILSSSDGTVIVECIKFPLIELWGKCDTQILAFALDEEQRKLKIMERDNISEKDFDKRDKASIDYSSCKFDYSIGHHYKDDELQIAVNNIYKERLILDELTELIESKILQNEEKVVFNFYELRVEHNLSVKETNKILKLIGIYLNNKGYSVYGENEQYEYDGKTYKVKSNELIVAIKGKNL